MTFSTHIGSRLKEAWSYRNEPENVRVLGTVLWRALLVIALIIIIFALWFGVQELNAVSQAESVQTTTSNARPPLDRTQLQSTLNDLLARQAQFQALSQSPVAPVTDPSK